MNQTFKTDPPENATLSGPDVVEVDGNLELTCSSTKANPSPSFSWSQDDLSPETGKLF